MTEAIATETSIVRISQALTKLLKEAPKKLPQLRTSLQEVLDYINKLKDEPNKLNANGVPNDAKELDKLANKLITPLKLACDSRNSKLMGLALDMLHKLIDYGYFRGGAVDEEDPSKKLMTKVIVTISSCFDYPDDNVQLQIIKAFHTAVASPICDVHETNLLSAVRTCYNIFLVSRNPVNQNTAKATLTQMLHIVFSRMELQMSPDVIIGIDDSFEDDIDEQLSRMEGGGSKKPSRESSMNDLRKELEREQAQEEKKQKMQLEENGSTPEGFAKDIVVGIINQIEKSNSDSSQLDAEALRQSSGHHIFADCYLVFRALCKLSMKDIPKESAADMNSIDMKSKILSLELLLGIIENSGPVFRSCDRFINTTIKKYLIISLLTNGVSPNPRVFRLSLSIFLALVSYFKDYLKTELGVFYTKIFLVILESGNSTIQQKWMVLQVLLQICKNPQALVDIFVNYDCDLNSKDVYERIVNDLSKIAHGKHAVGGDPTSEVKLKVLGLECLVTIMRSLVDWSKELRLEYESAGTSSEGQRGKGTKEEDVNNNATDGEGTPGGKVKSTDPDFNATRQTKLLLSQGIGKFNASPKKGMRFLIEHNFVENAPESVAKFLRHQEGLDKAAVGDYLGEKDEFNIKVLHCYVDNFSFAGLEIDLALRKFLSPFRLPGEAQKIDRMMEKFAERYFTHNQAAGAGFANADAVYILAFSIIMLATDLHSPSVKNKMTKPEWINLQSRNNDGKDYDKQFLSEVFDRIAAQAIKLQDDDDFSVTDLSGDPKQRRKNFQKEMENTITKSKQVIKEKAKDKITYYRAKQLELVKPMFEIAWCPMLAAFSVLMEDSDDPEVINMCLEGIKHNIAISCTFFMETERNTFVTTLAKFTFLTNIREMKQKNIESIKALMDIARTEANYLHDSWLLILRSISHLEQLHLIGSGASAEAIPISLEDAKKEKGNTLTRKSGILSYEIANAHMIAEQINATSIDKIFSNSINLNSNAIEDFTKALCQVSIDEIESPNPRIFSLQKLVELAHFNMDRIRLVWSRIWCILANHFTKVGCDKSARISMYAIDSLKQLAMKFLEKNELANYHFQKEFLKPFELIMANQSDVKLRDMVIRCLSNMILARAHNIKSGWKSIFVVFTVAATDHDETIVRLAFDMVQEVIRRYFHMITESFFVDCVNCLVAYGNGYLFIDISLKSIESLTFCAKELAEGKVIPLTSETENKQIIFTENDKHLSLWFPILTGLSGIIGHSHIDVRTAALRALFTTLSSYGSMFNKGFWQLMFRGVLLPIFDNVRYASGTDLLKEDNEWLLTTCLLALNSLIDLISQFFNDISFLLGELINLLANCILQENESLARIGATCYLELVMKNGTRFNEEMWTLVCARLAHVLENNSPLELIRAVEQEPSGNGTTESHALNHSERQNGVSEKKEKEEAAAQLRQKLTPLALSKVIRGKCTVQLGLIEALNEIAFTHYSSLSTHHLEVLLNCLEGCYSFCKEVNHNPTLRGNVEKAGLVDLLLRKETTSVSCYLRVLFRMYAETIKDSEKRNLLAEDRLILKCQETIADFNIRSSDSKTDHKKVVTAYNQIIVQILKGVGDLRDDQLNRHVSVFYPPLCDLILSESKEVRALLRQVFLRIGALQKIFPQTQHNS